MKKYFLSGFFSAFSLLLIGAGCVNTNSVGVSNSTSNNNNSVTGTITSSTDKTSILAVAVSANNTSTVSQIGIKVFNITATNFSFSVKEIKVKKGDKIIINFSSTDGYHDWVVDEFKAATQKVQTGGSTSVTFTVDKVGTYEYYCSVGSHRKMGMVGKLIVE